MFRRQSFSVSRIAFLTAAVVFSMLAARELYASIRAASISIIAERIERGQVVSDDVAARYASQIAGMTGGNYCRSDIVAAGATLVLSQLDRQNANINYEAWAAAAAGARDYLRYAVSCMPTNSNFWLRLAAIQSTIAEESHSIAGMMARSVALAPYDQSMVLTRFYFWNEFTEATLSASRRVLDRDLVTMLKLGDRCLVNTAMKAISPQLRPIFDQTWTSVGVGATARFRQRCSR